MNRYSKKNWITKAQEVSQLRAEYDSFINWARVISRHLNAERPDEELLGLQRLMSSGFVQCVWYDTLPNSVEIEISFSFMHSQRESSYWAIAISEGMMNEAGIDQELPVGKDPIPALDRLLKEYQGGQEPAFDDDTHQSLYKTLQHRVDSLTKETDSDTKLDLFDSIKRLPDSPQKKTLMDSFRTKANIVKTTFTILGQAIAPPQSLVGKTIEFEVSYTDDMGKTFTSTHTGKVLKEGMKHGKPSIICKDLNNGDIYEFYTDNGQFKVVGSFNKIARIVKRKGKYHVLSEKGKNLGGPYDTHEEAEKRLRQVEYFKHNAASSPRYTIKKNGHGEHEVKLYDENNKEVASYHTDDHEDAKDTAEVMMADYFAKKASYFQEGFNKIVTAYYGGVAEEEGSRENLKEMYGPLLPDRILNKILKEHGQTLEEYRDDGGSNKVDDVMNWLGY